MYSVLFEGFASLVLRKPRTGFRLIIATINNNHINLKTSPAKVLIFIFLNLHLDQVVEYFICTQLCFNQFFLKETIIYPAYY